MADYDSIIHEAGLEWGVDPRLLKAVMLQESRGDPGAVSKAGARGLMQIMPNTGKGLGMTDLHDPVQSIWGGAKYLAEALDKEGTPERALLYYHAGPDWRRKFGPESAAYVPGVQKHYAALAPKADAAGSPTPARVQVAENKTNTATDATPGAQKVTDDEFLKSTGAVAPGAHGTGAPQKAPAVSSDDEFLKATGAAPATPGAPETTPPPDSRVPQGEVPKRIREAAYQAFINAPSRGTEPGNMSVLSTGAQNWLNQNVPVVGPYVINPAAQLVGTAVGGVAAAGAAGAQTVNELVREAGAPPALQRDLNILAMASPGMAAEMTALSALRQPNLLARGVNKPVVPGYGYGDDSVPKPAPGGTAGGLKPQPGMGPKAVDAQPAGAQVTTAPIPEKTPAQRVTDLEKSVTQTAEDRAGPQLRDNTPYVADIPPRPLASREFHPKNSLDEKTAISKDEVFRADIEKVRRLRNEGMVDKLREDAADANALDAAHEARQQVSPAELGVFDNEQPTSVAGLAAKIDKLLSGPEGKQRAVRTTLEDVKKSLYDADGNLETMPSRIYGARKNLTDLLKRGAKGVGDVADDVRASKHVLESLLTDFDESITKGAGQFQDYLKQWSELSKPIDQMEFFQQYQTGSKKITDKDGYLIPTKVQKMLDDILQGHKAKGVNKAKSLTDEQIDLVVAVRNELAADSLKDRLASVKGSDTFQQFMQEAKAPGRVATGLKIAGELGIGIPTAGLGNFVIQRSLSHLERRAAAKAAEEAARRKRELLSPPNPLLPP